MILFDMKLKCIKICRTFSLYQAHKDIWGWNGFKGLKSRLCLLPRRSSRNFSQSQHQQVPQQWRHASNKDSPFSRTHGAEACPLSSPSQTYSTTAVCTFLLVDLCGLLHCVVSDRRSLWYASFVHNADIDPALRLLLPWSATYLRGILIFTTLFPVLVIRKADLHGTPSSYHINDVQSNSNRTPLLFPWLGRRFYLFPPFTLSWHISPRQSVWVAHTYGMPVNRLIFPQP